MKSILPLAVALLVSLSPCFGLTLLSDIHSPKDCGDAVRVETKDSSRRKGLVFVSVTFKPTVPELYGDRVKVFGELVVTSGGDTIAISRMEAAGKEGVFTFTFELARKAFRDSELMLSSQLFEKDGIATIGGGEVYRLHLGGFQPGARSANDRGPAPRP